MIFRCRDLQLNVWEFDAPTVSKAIETIKTYEQEHKTCVRAFHKDTLQRIVGGILKKTV